MKTSSAELQPRNGPEATMLAGFGLALATLVTVGFVQYRSIEMLTATDAWVAHTHSVLTELEAAYTATLQVVAGTQGYVLTARPEYLAQQGQGILGCKEHLHALRILTADNSRQQQKLDRLEVLVERKTAIMLRIEWLRRENGLPAASDDMRTEESLDLTKEIRGVLDAMKAEENSLLAQRQAASRTDARRSNAAIVLGTLLAVSLIGAAGWRMRRFNQQLEEQIIERRRAQEAVDKLNQELEQRVVERTSELAASNKELEAFAYSVSHDLRAPLRHMDRFLALLLKRSDGRLDESAVRYLDKAMASSRSMGVLIDDLLHFSRLGRNAMAKSQVSPQKLVHEVRLELETETAGRVITWKVGRLPEVVADPAMLRLVLVNLLSNALKFTRTRPEARIEVGCVPGKEDEDVIFVKDNGVGFDPQYVEKLFNVFQRLHPSSEFEGTGVGLANVRRIVERHGGRVWAEGAEATGATFYFSLPRLQTWGAASHERPETYSTYSAGRGQ